MSDLEITPTTDPPSNMPNPVDSGNRLDYIDGLRGIAVLWVMLYHIWIQSNNPAAYWWNPLLLGYQGVNLFLVLSGFCLYWPLVKDGTKSKEPTLMAFARRRARRLLPPYYAALGIFTLLAVVLPHSVRDAWCGTAPTHIWHSLLWHLFLLHNLRPEALLDPDGPMWSLALEVDLYIAFPILVVIARIAGIFTAVCLAAGVTLLYRLCLTHWIGGSDCSTTSLVTSSMVLFYALPGRWLEFALGMWAARLSSDADSRWRSKFPLLAIPAFALIVLGARLGLTDGHFDPFAPWTDTLCGIAFFLIILAAMPSQSGEPSGLLTGLLRSRYIVWMGLISYSIYLIHYPLLVMPAQLLRHYNMRDSVIFAICLLVIAPLIVGIASLFHRYFEKPFMNAQLSASALAQRGYAIQ